MKNNTAGLLKTVYLGGGTPSLLTGDRLRELFNCLRDSFELSPYAEITVESNPGTITKSKIHTLLSVGVNRVSVGIQSFDDTELKTLGRIHTSDDAARAVELIKGSGLKNISVDLIYGIPGQTIGTWEATLSRAVSLSPTHISAYELTPEKGTPLCALILSNRIKMHSEQLILDMYGQAVDYLPKSGYEHYEISNFALPGSRCAHNLNYWDRGEYVGAGAGAHSFIGGIRSRNSEDIGRYIANLDNQISPESEALRVSPEEALREFIFLGLRKTEGISITKSKASGLDVIGLCGELFEDGFIEIDGDLLRFTRKGMMLSNAVMVRLFERLGL